MADCNGSLFDAGYPSGMNYSHQLLLTDICYGDPDQNLFQNGTLAGPIINYCIYFCSTCPHFLFGMDHETRMSYLEDVMIPAAQDSGLLFSIVLSVLCIFGSIANFLTILVIRRNKVLQATSHYLLSLAVSDLFMLIMTAPIEIKYQLNFWPWYVPHIFCRLHSYIKEVCLYTTVLHIVAFTVERYIVICHPMRARTILSRSRACKVIVAIWVCSILLPIPVFVVFDVQEYCPGISQSSACFPLYKLDSFLSLFYGIISIILFLVPMTMILVLYSLIARALFAKNLTAGRRLSTKVTKRKQVSISDSVDKARQHAVKLLVLVAVFFFILWFPFMWIRLRPLIYINSENESAYHEWYYSISMSLLYLSSCTNPVLYNVMSARFRKAYKNTIMCGHLNSDRMRDGNMSSRRFYRTDTHLTSTNSTGF